MVSLLLALLDTKSSQAVVAMGQATPNMKPHTCLQRLLDSQMKPREVVHHKLDS